jgi:hypothetical protein
MRQNGLGTLTLEDARTWIEETGLCLFLPRRQFSSSVAPSFVEAVAGQRDETPDPKHIAIAEELLVRLELEGVAVRLNLLGQPGELPDFVVAGWVLPYVYALRGDRDWRRSPQLTGSRQVSQLAVLAYKRLEQGDATIADLKYALGREVTETAVLRAITELWQQLRIIPVIAAPGQPAKWQLLRQRFQKAIAEGASTSQVTAISVLASIYLQAVIAASMEDVEVFLSPLTARSKIREVLRGLIATRQVHTLSLGHAPHFYVAGTLPEFAVSPTIYASSAMPASAYFMRDYDHDEVTAEIPAAAPAPINPPAAVEAHKPVESHAPRTPVRKPAPAGKHGATRPHFTRQAGRDRKAGQPASGGRPAHRAAETRSTGSRPASGTRAASGSRWSQSTAKNGNGKHNGSHSVAGKATGTRHTGATARPANGTSSTTRSAKSSAPGWTTRNGHSTKKTTAAAKPGTAARKASLSRKDARPEARPARSSRKPALTAGAAGGNSKRYGFTSRPKQGTKKRG